MIIAINFLRDVPAAKLGSFCHVMKRERSLFVFSFGVARKGHGDGMGRRRGFDSLFWAALLTCTTWSKVNGAQAC